MCADGRYTHTAGDQTHYICTQQGSDAPQWTGGNVVCQKASCQGPPAPYTKPKTGTAYSSFLGERSIPVAAAAAATCMRLSSWHVRTLAVGDFGDKTNAECTEGYKGASGSSSRYECGAAGWEATKPPGLDCEPGQKVPHCSGPPAPNSDSCDEDAGGTCDVKCSQGE
jgi:hypothetical protein